MSENKTSLSYKDAGVDIDAGNQLVERIKSVTKKTHRPEVKGNLGGFGALCELPSWAVRLSRPNSKQLRQSACRSTSGPS